MAGLAGALMGILGTPGVRELVLDEVRSTLGKAPLDPRALPKLAYLEAAIQEALRLAPPLPIVVRWLAAPAAVGGLELPAGAYVAPCAWLAHRNEKVWRDPLRFDPERFLGARRPGPFEFFPFGGGNRLCIGLAFAAFEMKVILASLLARADLRLAEPLSWRARRRGIIVAPASGTRLVVERLLW
jgi:cytochrome P450